MLEELNNQWDKHNLPRLRTRFGLAKGQLIVGNIGAPHRMMYTVIGDTANLASRLEGLNKVYGTQLLVSDSIKVETEDLFLWRKIDTVRVKGKKEVVSIHSLAGRKDTVDEETLLFVELYEKALAAYCNADFVTAMDLISEMDDYFRIHPSVQRLEEMIQNYLENPPPHDFTGISIFEFK